MIFFTTDEVRRVDHAYGLCSRTSQLISESQRHYVYTDSQGQQHVAKYTVDNHVISMSYMYPYEIYTEMGEDGMTEWVYFLSADHANGIVSTPFRDVKIVSSVFIQVEMPMTMLIIEMIDICDTVPMLKILTYNDITYFNVDMVDGGLEMTIQMVQDDITTELVILY